MDLVLSKLFFDEMFTGAIVIFMIEMGIICRSEIR
jgi:hypothetical protein